MKSVKNGAKNANVSSGKRSDVWKPSRVAAKSVCHPARCSDASISQYPDIPIYGQSDILPSILIIPALITPPKLIIKTRDRRKNACMMLRGRKPVIDMGKYTSSGMGVSKPKERSKVNTYYDYYV